MAADALAPCTAKSSAAEVLTTWNIWRELDQYHWCWCPGSLCCQDIDSCSINLVGWTDPHFQWGWVSTNNGADSRFAPSQWEMSLQSNAVSHWLGTNLESAQNNVALFVCQWCSQYVIMTHASKWGLLLLPSQMGSTADGLAPCHQHPMAIVISWLMALHSAERWGDKQWGKLNYSWGPLQPRLPGCNSRILW